MAQNAFDPGQHLSKIKGQDYLEVKWRIAWLRAEHPDASLETQLHSHENGRAIFWARVVLAGGAMSTGWGSETADTFENYIEKAETKAIGRALAAIGFGTQFATDFDDGLIVDAPVSRGQGGNASSGNPRPMGPSSEGLATNAQKSMIQYKARQDGMQPEQIVAFIQETTGRTFNELTKREASKVIDALSDRQGPPPVRRG